MDERSAALRALIERELDERPATIRVNGERVTETSRDLVGLALSGGGIRSATFNLGLLQGLHHFRLLDRLDYLSTVSGGGYIGSFWTAWRARRPPQDAPAASFPDGTGSDGRAEPDAVRHLREFSNFLAPNLGFLSWDTGRIVVTLVSSLIPSLLTALAVIALAVLAWCLVAYGLFALSAAASVATLVAATALLLTGMEALWQRKREERDLRAYAEAWSWGLFSVGFIWWILLGVAPAMLGWYGGRLPLPGPGRPPSDWLYLLAPVVPWLGASFTMSLRRWLGSRWVTDHVRRVRRTSFDRVHARFLFAAAAWTTLTLLWWCGALLWGLAEQGFRAEVGTGLAGATAAVVLLFARVQKRLSAEFKSTLGTGLMARLRPKLPQLLAYLAIGLLVVAVVAGLVGFGRSDFGYPSPLAAAFAAALTIALSLVFFDPNEIGLHTFYRARLSRAYLGASNPDPEAWRKTEEREDDDLRLPALRVGAPCHLICCAANDLATRELGNLHRGADSAVLSPAGFGVGGWGRTWREDDDEVPTLSAAVTASAAAFNPLMGGKSKEFGPAVTFLMAAFNLRLGLWLPRERSPGALERRLVGLPFLWEMFGQASARFRRVHLSDGGHFENMAVYELIRRHCRFIVASDCGMDPSVAFDDFGNLVRRVRADFGVDIRIDLSPLRPDADGASRQPMVAGDIHYPEGDTGILLLIKPTLTGSEPADVAQYRARNRVFPHESTVDQFYDEAQWEAYRRLGEHVAHAAFRAITVDLDASAPGYADQVFLRARREWQAVPEGFGDRLSHFADRIEQLDALLRQPECATLLREVYREMDDLDRDRVQALGVVDERGVVRRPEAAPAAEPRRLPDPADLAPSLHLIRRVLLLMQEAYTLENLEENYHHPFYLGLMNYFARWASAPLFRLWWPLLKTMYPQPFTRFIERRYGLAGGRGAAVAGEVGAPVRELRGFAMSAWRQQRAEPLPEGYAIVPFLLQLRYQDSEYEVQAAQLVGAVADDALAWDAADFFVPPGLWGVGIGEQFLRRLAGDADLGGQAGSCERLFVRIQLDGAGGTAAKKNLANEIQLYRSAGFAQVADAEVPVAVRRALEPRDGDAAPGVAVTAKWMGVRRLQVGAAKPAVRVGEAAE